MSRTDTERLDALQKLTVGYGRGWLFRLSEFGRGYRLHETTQAGAVPDIRKAIDNHLDSLL